MTVQDFFNINFGKKIDTDGQYGAQCVDIINKYRTDVINTPAFGISYAKDIFSKGQDQHYLKFTSGVPQKGDILVWGSSWGGGMGHVGIATGKGDSGSFECFEQNNPIGSACKYVSHNYSGVIGWLRPKCLIVETPPPTCTPTIEYRDREVIKIEYRDNPDQQKIIDGLTSKLEIASKQVKQLTSDLNTLTEELKLTHVNHKEEVNKLMEKIGEQAKTIQLMNEHIEVKENIKPTLAEAIRTLLEIIFKKGSK